MGGNPTPTFEPIIFDSSLSLTSFEGSDFISEEIEAYLKDDSISPEIDHADFDPGGDICLIERLLNNDPFQLPLMDLKQVEVTKAKPSIEEPLELELKDLPSHLEYAYLEGTDKLPVLRRWGSISTSVYAVVQKLKKAFAKSFSSTWLTIPSWTMSIALTEVEMKCFTSRSLNEDILKITILKTNTSYPSKKIRRYNGEIGANGTLKKSCLPHPSPATLVVGEMHKEAQQAAGGPTSLGATSEEGAHPQLSSDFTAKADPGISTPKDSIS
ncbi:hypothetical protein Tco_0928489 [Tanacetum coccineum]